MLKRLNLSAFISAMNSIAHSTLSPLEKQIKLSQLQYNSRGKGGKKAHRTGHKHMAYVRDARKMRNKKMT